VVASSIVTALEALVSPKQLLVTATLVAIAAASFAVITLNSKTPESEAALESERTVIKSS